MQEEDVAAVFLQGLHPELGLIYALLDQQIARLF
jgi:hypothetical protein